MQSTLMRAISRGQLDGFPPRDVLRTIYVEHDIDESEAETPVVEFVHSDAVVQGGNDDKKGFRVLLPQGTLPACPWDARCLHRPHAAMPCDRHPWMGASASAVGCTRLWLNF